MTSTLAAPVPATTDDDQEPPVVFALAVNAAVAAAKAGAAVLTGSPAMLAEAAHSAVDCSTQLCLLAGERHGARRPAARYGWAMGAALVMFGSGGVAGIIEGVRSLAEHAHTVAPVVSLVVLAAASVGEGLSCTRALRSLNRSRHGLSWARHLRTTTDTASLTVLAEDSVDVLGNALAAAGIAAAWLTGSTLFDAAASVLVGLLLVVVSTGLLRRNARLLFA